MSGHKRTTVGLSAADLRRLEGVEGRLKSVEQDYGRIRERVRGAQREELEVGLQELNERQAAYQQALAGALGEALEGVQELEAQTGQALAEQAQALQEQMEGVGGGLWAQTAELLEAHREQMEALAAESAQERAAQLGQLRRELRAGRQGREELAAQALGAAEAQWGSLLESLDVERHAPGALERLRGELGQGWENYGNGMTEAGLVVGQRVSAELSRLRLEVEGKEWRRRCLLSAVRGRVRELVEIGGRQREVAAVGLDGEELGIEIDAAHWSGGRYEAVMKKLQAQQEQIARQGSEWHEEELKAVAEKLGAWEQELGEAVYWARRNVLASQVRYNIAGCVVQALEAQGFALAAGSYLGRDQRGAYQALLRHLDGSEVAVQVGEAAEGVLGLSQVELESLDASQRSEHELRQRAREVAQTLAEYGLQVGANPMGSESLRAQRSNPPGEEAPVNPLHALRERRSVYGRD